jgi:hypothetical protein
MDTNDIKFISNLVKIDLLLLTGDSETHRHTTQILWWSPKPTFFA